MSELTPEQPPPQGNGPVQSLGQARIAGPCEVGNPRQSEVLGGFEVSYPVPFDRLPLTTAVEIIRPKSVVHKPRSVGMTTIIAKARQSGMMNLRDEMMKRRDLL